MSIGENIPKIRNAETDKAVEEKFGKPDYTKSRIAGDSVLTPMIGNSKLIRVDKLLGAK